MAAQNIVGRAIEVLQKHYDPEVVLRYLERCRVIDRLELQTTGTCNADAAEQKLLLLGNVISSSAQRVDAFMRASLKFVEEGRKEFEDLFAMYEQYNQPLISRAESYDTDTDFPDLGDLQYCLPSPRSTESSENEPPSESFRYSPATEAHVPYPFYTDAPPIHRRSSINSQDSGQFDNFVDEGTPQMQSVTVRSEGAQMYFQNCQVVHVHHHVHMHREPDNLATDTWGAPCALDRGRSSSQPDAIHFTTGGLPHAKSQAKGIRRWHTFSSADAEAQGYAAHRRFYQGNTLMRARSALELHILNQCNPDIMQYMNTRSLLPYLRSNHLVTSEEVEFLTNPTRTERECIEYLLKNIPRKGPNAFDKLVKSLTEDSEHEGHQYLAKKLLKTKTKYMQDNAVAGRMPPLGRRTSAPAVRRTASAHTPGEEYHFTSEGSLKSLLTVPQERLSGATHEAERKRKLRRRCSPVQV